MTNHLAKTVSRRIAARGELVTLRRGNAAAGANAWTAGALDPSYWSGYGQERHARPGQVRGAVQEHDKLVVISPMQFPEHPKVGDWMALGVWAQDNTDGYFDWLYAGLRYRWSYNGHEYQYGNTLPAEIEWWAVVDLYTPRVNGADAVYRVHVRR